jgi:hypothetical protein
MTDSLDEIERNTFRNLFALVNFGSLFFEEFIALLTNLQKICAWNTCLFDFDKNFLAYFGCCFEFCKSVGIGKRIVLCRKG